MNFLEAHYDRYRRAGGDHTSYVIANDLSEELGRDLKNDFEARRQAEEHAALREYHDQLYVGDLT